jgi:hypothetical protein
MPRRSSEIWLGHSVGATALTVSDNLKAGIVKAKQGSNRTEGNDFLVCHRYPHAMCLVAICQP